MKEFLGLVITVLSGIGAFFGVIGGAVMLNTFWLVFVVLFVVKILIIVGVLAITLSWGTVFLVPIVMFFSGWVFIGLGMLMGVVTASIADSL